MLCTPPGFVSFTLTRDFEDSGCIVLFSSNCIYFFLLLIHPSSFQHSLIRTKCFNGFIFKKVEYIL